MIIYALPWEIQLSRGEGCDPVIKRRGLWPSYQEERVVIQLSRGEGWDPVIKRRGLGSSHQEERVVIQLSRGEGWDPINLFNPATLLYLSQARPSISKVTCSGLFCVYWEGGRWLFCVFFSQISFVCFVDIDGICEHHCLSSLS